MKSKFEGICWENIPAGWDERTSDNPWMQRRILDILMKSNDNELMLVTHDDYVCCEYRMSMNIFSFSRLRFSLPFRVVGLPVSVASCGYSGDVNALIRDYRRRKGLFLILNLANKDGIDSTIAAGHTLPTCLFDNNYQNFEQYLSNLRSPYRRRILTAIVKGSSLTVKQIKGEEFSEPLYQLYLNVLHHSKYPLETLDISFFQEFDGQIHLLEENDVVRAFIMTKIFGDRLTFVFGGMDYGERDRLDLYYNMLLQILRLGIDTHCPIIDFGQTVESVKCRIGCRITPRYMLAFSRNRLINLLFHMFSGLLEYENITADYRVFKSDRTEHVELV